ncbi:hypothetical protein AKJ09_10857 [Labilithrix luteola]|uniref:Tryptophan synthase alpha chain n=1 Tax=Labilithrix luteola TaxID=1391654 RepID=A0A0K1QEL1_9BACT|nr:hypothetical protein [Labilithrix luteola]AKV04194.1 hypothetical protein AKJ09_10857 [Labilithrix luteola]
MRAFVVFLSSMFVVTALLASTGGCETMGDSADGGADSGVCGQATCSSTQFCLYRECTTKERCIPSTSCPTGTTPADCDGRPGCLSPTCGPVLQGCREIPTTCGSDVTCACGSVCGSPSACSKVDGRNALCAAAN